MRFPYVHNWRDGKPATHMPTVAGTSIDGGLDRSSAIQVSGSS